MNKKLFILLQSVVVTASLLFSASTTANAEVNSTSWTVSYDGSKITSDHEQNGSSALISGTMPGDTINYEVTYVNNSAKPSNFYMASDIISTLEENKLTSGTKASGGAYSYTISYDLGAGANLLYDSDTLGGDVTDSSYAEGLKQASENGNYFFVGKLEPGKQGVVKVSVALDGSTQDNSYMTTLAKLGITFGVEDASVIRNKVVYTTDGGTQIISIKNGLVYLRGPKTGDSMLPIILCALALLAGISLVVYYFMLTRRQQEVMADEN